MSSSSTTPSTSRRRRQRHVQQYDSSSDEEEESEDGSGEKYMGAESSKGAAANPPQTLNRSHTNTANTSSRRRPPPQPLETMNPPHNARANSRAKVRNLRPSDGGPSSARTPSPSYFPPIPPSTLQDQQQQQRQQTWADQLSPPLPKPRTARRLHRPRTSTVPPALDQSGNSTTDYSSSSTASSMGPWQPVAGPLKRSKTIIEPASKPVQAIVPRAPRHVAATRIAEEDDNDGGDVEEISGMPMVTDLPLAARPSRKTVAGGKKAALAVELKMNLEIEIELKACIHGDVTLELFN